MKEGEVVWNSSKQPQREPDGKRGSEKRKKWPSMVILSSWSRILGGYFGKPNAM